MDVRSPPAPLPPAAYEFWSTSDQRCLYVGKASRNPGDRIKAHFDNRQPWALSCDWIRINWLPGATPAELDLAEQARIRQLTPRGNRQHNTRHYDRTWALRVQRAALIQAGERIPFTYRLALARAWVTGIVSRATRAVLTAVMVNTVLLALWAAVVVATSS